MSCHCDLTLFTDDVHAGALIGKAGATMRQITSKSGVSKIQISQPSASKSNIPREVRLTGSRDTVKAAYRLVVATLRRAGADKGTTLSLPYGAANTLIGAGGEGVRWLRKKSGAQIEVAPAGDSGSRVISIIGGTERIDAAVLAIVDAIADRESERHGGFLGRWPFATAYNDHFETPLVAYEHILPIIRKLERRRKCSLKLYDPYYCEGAFVDALVRLGCARINLIHERRDFYSDIAKRNVPTHDVLVTNPPYSAEHKQKLLRYLEERHGPPAPTTIPFLLLMPAWVAATDYWRGFVSRLALQLTGRTLSATDPKLEREAGVFYLSPVDRYAFTHAEETGHESSPFHAVWFCGGFGDDLKLALKALKPMRRAKPKAAVEVFRSNETLQKRGFVTTGASTRKRAREG